MRLAVLMLFPLPWYRQLRKFHKAAMCFCAWRTP
jgi:hypothetical protein